MWYAVFVRAQTAYHILDPRVSYAVHFSVFFV